MAYDLLIFDLDGTLLDTSEGIFNSVRYAEKCMGFEPIPYAELRKFVGPPPKEMYKKTYGVSEEIASEAAKKHREYSRTQAIYEAKPYKDVLKTLIKLKNEGYKLAVATLKSKPIADEVLKLNQLYDLFDIVVGMDERETLSKSDTILNVMDCVKFRKKALMIGDSEHDYNGAVQSEVDFLGVLFGFGFHQSGNYPFDTVKDYKNLYEYVRLSNLER